MKISAVCEHIAGGMVVTAENVRCLRASHLNVAIIACMECVGLVVLGNQIHLAKWELDVPDSALQMTGPLRLETPNGPKN